MFDARQTCRYNFNVWVGAFRRGGANCGIGAAGARVGFASLLRLWAGTVFGFRSDELWFGLERVVYNVLHVFGFFKGGRHDGGGQAFGTKLLKATGSESELLDEATLSVM